MFLKSRTPKPVVYRTKHLKPSREGEETVDDRQRKIEGYNPEALSQAKIIMIGAGGLGSQIGEAVVRKGVGTLVIFDHDLVELTNLNRQKFYERDVGKNKAVCLARNLAQESFCGTVIRGYGLSFQDALALGIDMTCSVAICGVDNNPCRVAVSRYYRERHIPCIFTAVSQDTTHGYVFVQEAGADKACFACQFPKAVNDATYPCGTPAVIDILKVVAGIVSYGVDTILMERPWLYQYKTIHLDGFPGKDWLVKKRPDCLLCGVSIDETLSGCCVNNTPPAEARE
jgi:molybdopterin/thiamine biosynthesis adenylyltransferase